MSDACDAKVGRRGHRLDRLLVVVETTVLHALRVALRKLGRSEQLSGERGEEFSRGNLLGLKWNDEHPLGR